MSPHYLLKYDRQKHSHTHLFNSPLSGTTRVGPYQKGKNYLDFTEARDSEWQWHQLGHIQVCTSLQTDNHASTPPLSFLQAGCPSENRQKSEICTVINDKSQDNTAKQLSCEGLLHYKFIFQFAGERTFKIGEHLEKLQAKWLIVSYAHSPQTSVLKDAELAR